MDRQYQALLQDILDNGVQKKDRTGTGTLSVFGRQIRHKMSEGYPLLTTKKMAFKSIITELIWFIMGGTNIKFLVDSDCHIWVGDAYKRYVSLNSLNTDGYFTQQEFIDKIKTDSTFAQVWGELGKIYGYQWRKWKKINEAWDERLHPPFKIEKIEFIDQIENLINELKTNPDSRRMLVSTWNVGELDEMVLPPCHYAFQVYTRKLSGQERLEWVKAKYPNIGVGGFVNSDEYAHGWIDTLGKNVPKRAISLMWSQRSVDTFLGLPFNIASYGALLMMLADELQMVPDELIGNLGDTHLYLNHIEQAKEQISREPFPLPTLKVEDGMYCRHVDNFYLENYQSHPAIKAPLSN